MSTSAEHRLPDGGAVRLEPVSSDDPVARDLVERVQQEYVARYGGRDDAVVTTGEFDPPDGLFLVAWADGAPAGSGAYRRHGPGVVEVKRVYVAPEFRRRGLARLLMAALEEAAAASGARSLVLNSGHRQPEALRLYEELGYRRVPGYGIYERAPGAVFLGKELRAAGQDGRPWAS